MNRKLLYILVTLSLFSGLFGYMAYLLDNPIIRLWKEFLIIGFFLLIFFTLRHRLNKKWLIAIWITICSYFIFYLNSIELPFMMIFYQLKLDSLILIFIFGLVLFLSNISKSRLELIVKTITKLLLTLSFLNALAIFFQHFFTTSYFNLIGFTWGNWGTDIGIKIQTSNSVLRAPGLLTGFVQSGTLMLIATIILWEVYSRKIIRMNKLIFIFLFILFSISIYFTLYKTAIIGLILFLSMKTFEYLFKNKQFIFAIYLILFPAINIIFFVSSHTFITYNFVNTINPFYAYYSIYLRVVQHLEVISTMNTFSKLLFGAGMGLNGTGNFSFDKSQFGMESFSLDSTYIYLLSNYGFITVILTMIFLTYLFNKLFRNSKDDVFGARYIIVYIFCVEFYFNNIIINFPINIIIALITIIPLMAIKLKNKEKISYTKDNNKPLNYLNTFPNIR